MFGFQVIVTGTFAVRLFGDSKTKNLVVIMIDVVASDECRERLLIKV